MKKRIFSLSLLAMASTTFIGCSNNDDSADTNTNGVLYTEVLTDLTTDVITATYNDLNEKALALRTAVSTLSTETTEENFNAARTAWSATRAPWEESEGFLYGPVDTGGIDPAMDTWPVDVSSMNAILNSGQPITPEVIATNNEARGFHLIEFLLWGENGDKTVEQMTERQLEYLVAAAADLQSNTQTLYDGWKADGGNFGSNFINAGVSSNLYPSQKAALEEVIEGIIIISDEVANGKIEDPLNSEGGTPNAQFEESRFSNNSKLDFANNIRSIQNIYMGDFNGVDGAGLTDIVALTNPTLDADIKAKITAAITAIENIPGTFTDAIYNNRESVSVAQQRVSELLAVLQGNLKPYVNSL
ncbi:imelysin [Flavobacterium arcticum]|uniref:Imelysin n=1 Tax=Flavobacterium arcticum TaxID=1784713 RepID=A0A345HEJ6_9FLAO|nr:imelysin family protein [Flavobacterium arcticum]AXG75006.1 imelysin [Flavobacterium arcticum]KAF2506559.1 imelysin [Flavobacterium arcticum]